ncbi:sugar ABC transporter permease [Streptococcus suis]|nr:sugar ABC transporter permease [Streptococcus suis]
MNQKGFIAKYWPYLFVAIPISLQLIFFFYPLFTGIFYSLTDWNGLTSDFSLIGVQNYLDILKNPDFYTSMTFTIIFTIGLVIGEIVIGIWLASLLNRKIKAVGFFRTWYFFPAVLSTVTLGLIFYYLSSPSRYLTKNILSSIVKIRKLFYFGLKFSVKSAYKTNTLC